MTPFLAASSASRRPSLSVLASAFGSVSALRSTSASSAASASAATGRRATATVTTTAARHATAAWDALFATGNGTRSGARSGEGMKQPSDVATRENLNRKPMRNFC